MNSGAPTSPCTSTPTTIAPSRVKTSTDSRPITPAAPVITQTFPSSAPTQAALRGFGLIFMPLNPRGAHVDAATHREAMTAVGAGTRAVPDLDVPMKYRQQVPEWEIERYAEMA